MHFKFLISTLALQENDINSERTCPEENFTSADKDDDHMTEQLHFHTAKEWTSKTNKQSSSSQHG
jgi:hypothetical protein